MSDCNEGKCVKSDDRLGVETLFNTPSFIYTKTLRGVETAGGEEVFQALNS